MYKHLIAVTIKCNKHLFYAIVHFFIIGQQTSKCSVLYNFCDEHCAHYIILGLNLYEGIVIFLLKQKFKLHQVTLNVAVFLFMILCITTLIDPENVYLGYKCYNTYINTKMIINILQSDLEREKRLYVLFDTKSTKK